MGIYEDWQIHTKTGFRPIKLQESRSGPHTDRMPSNNADYEYTKVFRSAILDEKLWLEDDSILYQFGALD